MKKNFLREFQNLLSKYNAELSCEDYEGYPKCGTDYRLVIDFPDSELVFGPCIDSEDLGPYIDSE